MNTVDIQEIQNFSRDSSHWWDPDGPFKPLHRLNPVRLSYIKEQICQHFDRDFKGLKPFEGLKILDAGCGGGLVCEPMARLGAEVTGIDADENAIEVAKAHALEAGLKIDYQATTTHETGGQYDVVLALEIIEHVSNVGSFVESIAKLCKPGGLIIFSTLNRTPKSFALGIVAAEYILRWVPQGTHNWKKFVKPAELSRALRQNGVETKDIKGLIFNPINGNFSMSERDIDVNYFVTSVKA